MDSGIILFHIGGAGISSCDQIWQNLQQECQVNDFKSEIDKNLNKNCFFTEKNKSDNQYVPKAILIDTDGQNMDQILKNSDLKNKISSSQIIKGKEDSSDNYIRGHYTIGKRLLEEIMDTTRKQVECCDRLQGFQVIRSLTGGSGSGLGNLINDRLSLDFGKSQLVTFEHLMDIKRCDNVTGIYNTILGLETSVDLRVYFQKEAIYRMIENNEQYKNNDLGLEQLNQYFAEMVSNFNLGIIHKVENVSNSSLNEIISNSCGQKDVNHCQIIYNKKIQFQQFEGILNESYNYLNSSIYVNEIKQSKTFSSNVTFMGCIEQKLNLIKYINEFKQNYERDQSIPTGLKISHIPQISYQNNQNNINLTNLNTLSNQINNHQNQIFSQNLINNQNIANIFRKCLIKFRKLYDYRAFIHWYVGEGLDEGFFGQAVETLIYIIRLLNVNQNLEDE